MTNNTDNNSSTTATDTTGISGHPPSPGDTVSESTVEESAPAVAAPAASTTTSNTHPKKRSRSVSPVPSQSLTISNANGNTSSTNNNGVNSKNNSSNSTSSSNGIGGSDKSAISALANAFSQITTHLTTNTFTPQNSSQTNNSDKQSSSFSTSPQLLSTILPALQTQLNTLNIQLSALPASNSSSNNSASNSNNNNANSDSSVSTTVNSKKEILLRNFISNLVPTVTQNTLKMMNDNPPIVHLSQRDSAPQLQIPTSNTDNANSNAISTNNSSSNTSNTNDGNSTTNTTNTSATQNHRRLTVRGGMRGYRMVRATHGVSRGNWYFEVQILPPPSVTEVVKALPQNVRLGEKLKEGLRAGILREQQQAKEREEAEKKGMGGGGGNGNSATSANLEEQSKNKKRKTETASSSSVAEHSVGGHLRIGWSMRTGELQAPVGYDQWSYGYRDISGSRIHNSKREDRWGGEPFGPGDVVGFAIGLVGNGIEGGGGGEPSGGSGGVIGNGVGNNDPASGSTNSSGSNSLSSTKKNNAMTNHIRFFKNGEAMGQFVIIRGNRTGGEAFENITPGTYYPAISSYMGGAAHANFGPHFIYPPRGLPSGMSKTLRPMSEGCSPPPYPEDVVNCLKKEKFFGKKVDEGVIATFFEAVKAEAKIRYDCYESHMQMHLDEVKEARTERGLSTDNLGISAK